MKPSPIKHWWGDYLIADPSVVIPWIYHKATAGLSTGGYDPSHFHNTTLWPVGALDNVVELQWHEIYLLCEPRSKLDPSHLSAPGSLWRLPPQRRQTVPLPRSLPDPPCVWLSGCAPTFSACLCGWSEWWSVGMCGERREESRTLFTDEDKNVIFGFVML